MDVDLIFRIAAVGILVAVLGQLLTRSGREEQALMTTLAGLIVVLMLIVQEISQAVYDDEKRVRVLNGLIAACGLVLLVLVLSMTLKKDVPAIAFLLTLTAGVLILLRAFDLVGGTMQRFSGLLAQGGITQSLYLPVLKTVGVAVVVRIMSALCRDSGQSALAAKLEIVGAVLALSMCLPLLEQVLELVADWTI